MGIYTTQGNNTITETLQNPGELLESYIYDELCYLSDEKKQEFINSEEAKVMEEAGLISRRTLVRLSKQDDLSRRLRMAAFQLAKEKDDALWKKLVANRVKERELISAISAKYGSKATQVAKIGQRDYLKQKMPLAFMRPANN